MDGQQYRLTMPVSAAPMQWDSVGVDMMRMPALVGGDPLPEFVTAEQVRRLLEMNLIERVEG